MLAAAIVLAHLAAAAAALVTLPGPAAAVVAAGIALSAVVQLRAALQRSPEAVTGLELTADGGVAVAGPTGEWTGAQLRTAAVPAAWLAVVTLRDGEGRRRPVVVLPDALDPEAFRRLRVWLRWAPVGDPPGTDSTHARPRG
jgi:toxin CptA